MTFNAQHPGAFSYFTPPPLAMSVGGEVLGQWLQQGVDVWHAGPVGAFVEEEVTRWLCDLVGFRDGRMGRADSAAAPWPTSWRSPWPATCICAKLRGLGPRPARCAIWTACACTRATRRTSPIGRALDVLGFPRGHAARGRRPTSGSGSRPSPVAAADRGRPRRRADPARDLAPSPARRTPARSTTVGARRLSPSARAAGSTWTPPTGAPRGCPRATRDRVPGPRARRLRHGRSAQVVLPGLRHRRPRRAPPRGPPRRRSIVRPSTTASNRPEDAPLNWYQYSIEGTRRFRALKLWMCWKHLGTEGLGGLVEHNDDLAAYLAETLREAPRFRCLAVRARAVGRVLPPPAGRGGIRRRRARRLPERGCSARWRSTAPRG